MIETLKSQTKHRVRFIKWRELDLQLLDIYQLLPFHISKIRIVFYTKFSEFLTGI